MLYGNICKRVCQYEYVSRLHARVSSVQLHCAPLMSVHLYCVQVWLVSLAAVRADSYNRDTTILKYVQHILICILDAACRVALL